jgi:hypothetical protein
MLQYYEYLKNDNTQMYEIFGFTIYFIGNEVLPNY